MSSLEFWQSSVELCGVVELLGTLLGTLHLHTIQYSLILTQTDRRSESKNDMTEGRHEKSTKQFSFKAIVLEFMKDHPGLTFANVSLALLLTPIHDILLPHMYGVLVNDVQQGSMANITRHLTILLVIMLTIQLGGFAKDYLDTQTQPRLFDYIKTRMVAAMLAKYDGNLAEPKTGQIISKIVRAPDIVAYWISTAINHFGPQLISFGYAVCYFMMHDTIIGTSLLILSIAIALLLFVSPRQCMHASAVVEQLLDRLYDQADDILRNLVSIYSNDTGATEIGQLNITGNAFLKASIRAMACLLKYKAVSIPLIMAFLYIMTTRGCDLVRTKKISVGTFVSIFMIGTTMIGNLQWLVSLIRDASMDTGTITEAQAMFSIVSDPVYTSESRHGDGPPKSGIGMDRVSFGHGPGTPMIFQDASIHIDAGERIVITGNIGSGKSTLVKLLMAFLRPDSGDLYINGQRYSDIEPREVRQHVAYMPQDAHLFDRTLGENILYGSQGKSEADAQALMEAYGIWQEFATLEKGLDTPVGKNGSNLSGGQRQLAYFSRILLRNPSLLILDEPTASMDAPTKRTLLNAVEMLAQVDPETKPTTVIMITHDDDLVSFATRRIHLDGGAYGQQ